MKVFVFAGVNGAGKTTLYYNELEQKKDFGRRINIDEIVSSFGDWKNQKDQIRASKIAINLRNIYIQNNYDFNIETTLCGSSILALFEKLKENSYDIYLYYVKVASVEIAKERVKQRVKKGGHDIDERLIEKRFKQSLENLDKVMPLCKGIFIFDNSQNKLRLINSMPNAETRKALDSGKIVGKFSSYKDFEKSLKKDKIKCKH